MLDKSLVVLEDLLVKSFYISLDKKYKKHLITKAINKSKDIKVLSNKLGCHKDTVRNFKNNKLRSINAIFLKKLLNFLDIPIYKAEKHVLFVRRGCGANREVNINFPIKSSPELALVLAKSLGDGGVLSDWRFHYTNGKRELIDEVVCSIEKSIGKSRQTLHFRRKRGTYDLKFSPVIGFVLNLAGAPRGSKVKQKFGIPKWIMRGDNAIKSNFLRGIFDDECCVDFNEENSTRRIIFAMGKVQVYEDSLKKFLNQIIKLLNEFNIQSGKICLQEKYNNKLILRFGIYRKLNFEKFEKEISFTNKEKKMKIHKIINSY